MHPIDRLASNTLKGIVRKSMTTKGENVRRDLIFEPMRRSLCEKETYGAVALGIGDGLKIKRKIEKSERGCTYNVVPSGSLVGQTMLSTRPAGTRREVRGFNHVPALNIGQPPAMLLAL
jgi:hypothetical protein